MVLNSSHTRCEARPAWVGRVLCDPTHVRNLTQTHRGGQWKAGPGARVGMGDSGQGAQGLVTQDGARLDSAANVALWRSAAPHCVHELCEEGDRLLNVINTTLKTRLMGNSPRGHH